jgi:uncharacterized protein
MKLLLIALILVSCGKKEKIIPLTDFREMSFEIGGKEFLLYLADNQNKLRQGLMYVKHLDENKGMIFTMPSPAKVSFWMKNTYIPLDMVFVDDTGRVIGCHPDAKPLDKTLIHSPDNTKYVVELNVSSCSKIRLGDTMAVLE